MTTNGTDVRKYSVVLKDGRKTSVSMEPEFWKAMREMLDETGETVASLVTRIKDEEPRNVSSALRLRVLRHLSGRVDEYESRGVNVVKMS